MLIGNKVDKPNKVITSEMGAEFARQKQWGFMEVSAKEDINIKSAFQTLVNNTFQAKNRGAGAAPDTGLPIGQSRSVSISLHEKNSDKSKPAKSKKDGKCCK